VIALPDIIALSLRSLSFVFDLQAAGIAMFLVLFSGSVNISETSIRKLGLMAAIGGVILTGAHYLVEPARMLGLMPGVFDTSLHMMLLGTNVAVAAVVRIVGLVLLLLGMKAGSHRGDEVSLMGAMLVLVSFSLVGHTSTHDLRWVLITLLLGHMMIVALWFGSLLPLWLISKQESITVSSVIIGQFSSLAAWTVPLLFLAGLGMAIVLVGNWANLWTAYGISILLKIALFVLLMGLAALNKWRLVPAIAAGSVDSLTTFRRSIVAEWCLMVCVLVVTAVMTGLFSPNH